MAAFQEDKNPFSPAFCGALLRLFSICYRHGVEEACVYGDADACEEILEKAKNPEWLGTVRFDMDWNEWQFKVLQWTRDDICRARTMDLVLALRKPGHRLGFLMQIAKMYYVRGVRDWVERRDWLTKEIARNMPNYPYLLKYAHSYRRSKIPERFEQLQNECFNLIEMQNLFPLMADEYRIRPSLLRVFVERVWSAIQNPKWFDDFDLEDGRWEDTDPTKDVKMRKVLSNKHYDKRKNNGKKADRRVSRKSEGSGDAAAGGPELQHGAAKRRPGRPPKVL